MKNLPYVNIKALSEAKQSRNCERTGLLRRFAPRNDGFAAFFRMTGLRLFSFLNDSIWVVFYIDILINSCGLCRLYVIVLGIKLLGAYP